MIRVRTMFGTAYRVNSISFKAERMGYDINADGVVYRLGNELYVADTVEF